MRSILVIDNYDSFTWNLVGALEILGAKCDVVASDAMTFEDVVAHPADGVLLSPGPCSPREAGVSMQVARRWDARRPLLGVCLGHQVIGEAFGGRVIRAPEPVHGKTSRVHHDGRGVFEGIDQPFEAMRYHSLVVDEASLPAALEVSARAEGVVMGLRHRSLPIEGIQFHPESFLSVAGPRILDRWLRIVRSHRPPTELADGLAAETRRGPLESAATEGRTGTAR